ncbi:PA0069 family radical SAM protein [soil metagenome]|nr:PA0069 family radical SAM protein [Trueperaceae bacterium]
MTTPQRRGRGAGLDPANRFTHIEIAPDGDELDHAFRAGDDENDAPTRYLRDTSRRIISTNDSPDIGFDASLNPYRGCEHGCSYCYARPTHEYLGLSAGLDFERVIMVKEDAPELLAAELAKASWRPRTLALSGVTDPYQPVERRLEITRRCLQVLAAHRNPVAVITKNALVTRDVDVLQELAAFGAASVTLSITTLDEELRRVLEPRTSTAARRLAGVRTLAQAGVSVGVNVAPIIPGLNDHEVPAILEAAAAAGATRASYTLLRLPGAVAEIFTEWLRRHRPERADRVLARIRDARGGRLNDARFGHRMHGSGPYADSTAQLFRLGCARVGLAAPWPPLETRHFRVPGTTRQGGLFDGDGAAG